MSSFKRAPDITPGTNENTRAQTTSGTMSSTGVPDISINPEQVMMTIQQAMATPRFITTWTISVNQTPGTMIGVIHPWQAPTNTIAGGSAWSHWADLAMTSGVYWVGKVTWRFWMIKNGFITGRLLFRYRPESYSGGGDTNFDPARRELTYEWDLAEADKVELSFGGFCPIPLRPTMLPYVYEDDATTATVPNGPNRAQYQAGTLRLEVATAIQPGGLYPDSYSILVDENFEVTNYVYRDPRFAIGDYRYFHDTASLALNIS